MSSIAPTGNPFVDTGLYAMQARASELHSNQTVEVLTTDLLSKVLGDGTWLAKQNRQLNSFFMVCTNSALVNSSSNKKLYSKPKGSREWGYLDPEDEGWQEYVKTLLQLRDELMSLDMDATYDCESCGERPATQVLNRVGRDYFPLAGSLGNDAQALPAASRAPRVCAFCLIAVQWVPLGAIMFNGRLGCFQFTDSQLSQFFVGDTYRETSLRLASTSSIEKVVVPGSKGGSIPAAQLLLERMRKLQQERASSNLPDYVTLNIWAFSNSGQDADCEIIEVPNSSLQFLWEAARSHWAEVTELLKREDAKKSDTQLLSCIERQRDYSGFYPLSGKKSRPPASKSLYELYQTRVLGRPLAALRVADVLASKIYARLKSGDKQAIKMLAALLKENPRWAKDQTIRVSVKKVFAELAEAGFLTLDDYAQLFPAGNFKGDSDFDPEHANEFWLKPGRALRTTSEGWDVFWFYLHHAKSDADQNLFQSNSETQAETERKAGNLAMFTNPKIKTFASDVFQYYLTNKGGTTPIRGLSWIKRNILEAFGRGKITTGDLRRWFFNLAEIQAGYTNEEWDALCRDEQGRESTAELRFQFRLEIANLYREAAQQLVANNP